RASDRRDIHELMDCRLAVALVRFSRMLRHLGIVELIHYSTYRAPGSRAVAQNPVQSRHAGGMAIDAAWFVREDGARFNVERDFHGHRGRVVCGPEARVPHHDAARMVRTIACDAARRGIFTVILTPNFNYQHRNHFHMEVTRNASWRFVH
ncbi:MAG: extensin family protein, partial [Deltaproteobacteria bacterium]